MSKPAKSVDQEGKELVDLLKEAEIFTKGKDPWYRIKVVKEPTMVNFEDIGQKMFMGYAFSDKTTDKLYFNPPSEITRLLKSKKQDLVYNDNEPHVIEKKAKYGEDMFYGYYTVVSSKADTVKRLEKEIESSETVINLSKGEEVHSKMTRDLFKLLAHAVDPDEIFACLVASIDDVTKTNKQGLTALVDALEMYTQEIGIKQDKKKAKA